VSGQRRTVGAILDASSRGANRLAEGVMAGFLAAMALLVGVQIAGRFVFSYSIFWSDELARFLLVWISFLGMSIGVRRGAHPGIDSLARALPPWPARVVLTLALLLSLLFFAVMMVYGWALVVRTWPQRSVSLGLRMGIPYLAVPASGLLMFLHAAAIGVRGEPPLTGAGEVHGD
jgi:TRAP-type C4-dicarboxylate transport system permease small subunit